jgi:integrase/recombinase XerD
MVFFVFYCCFVNFINFVCGIVCGMANYKLDNMKAKKPTIGLFLETREPKEDQTYPLKIRVTWQRQRKYFAVKNADIETMLKRNLCAEFIYSGKGDFSVSKEVFQKTTGAKPRGKFASLKRVFDELVEDAKEKAGKIEPFNFDTFSGLYADPARLNDSRDIFATFIEYINQLKNEGRIRTAVSYGCTLSSLQKFYTKEVLPFEKITKEFLLDYSRWMTEHGRGDTTIGIYARQLRTIFNKRPEGLNHLPKPFGEKGFQIPTSAGRKIALRIDELKKVFEYQPEPGTPQEKYLDFWRLQYLMSGINITDLLSLRFVNIQGNFIVFERAKTKRTRKKSEPIRIPINDKINQLITKYAQKRNNEKTLVFPILTDKMTPEERDAKIQYFAKAITKTIKKIATKLEIDPEIAAKLTSYSSRHSYASTLMKKGAPIAFISKQLGHSSMEVTSNYLSSFEDEDLKEWQGKLTEF